MDNLKQKYINNRLSFDELKVLRDTANSMSDDEIETFLLNEWNSTESVSVENNQLDKMKDRIDNCLFAHAPSTPLYLKWIRMVAAVLLLILMLTTFYLYRENSLLLQKDFVVSTSEGEQVSIFLPDGSQITLNENSYLSYNLSEYNSNQRKVFFDGEGYFQVKKNPHATFSVLAQGLKVEVLGTIFCLVSRSSQSKAELSLEEGSVRFLSLKTGQNVILSPDQKAVLDLHTGEVKVEKILFGTDASAWKRGELVFRNVAFKDVLKKIEETYHVTIIMKTGNVDYYNDLFTGVLSRTNINEVLEVIEYAYHLKAILKDGTIIFVQK